MLRLGIIDLDSSHSVEFTKRFNHVGVSRDQFVDGARVVLAVPGQSAMTPERIPRHAESLKAMGVELADSPDRLLGNVDGVLVCSVRGGAHLEGARLFLEAGVPTFVDKPFASSWEDAQSMADLAAGHNSVVWSSSALRFAEEVRNLPNSAPFGNVLSAVTFGPAIRAEGNPGLLHYGIHAAEILFALMGPDWENVSCLHQPGADLVSVKYSGGRVAAVRGARSGNSAYGFTAFCDEGVVHQIVSTRFGYRNLCRAIVQSFETGRAPVPIETTLKLMKFLLAANQSEHAGGSWISLSS